jgi:hypothetical protein
MNDPNHPTVKFIKEIQISMSWLGMAMGSCKSLSFSLILKNQQLIGTDRSLVLKPLSPMKFIHVFQNTFNPLTGIVSSLS